MRVRYVFQYFGVIIFSVIIFSLLVLIAYFRLPWLFLYFYLAKQYCLPDASKNFFACVSSLYRVISVIPRIVLVSIIGVISLVLISNIVFLYNPQAISRKKIVYFFVRKRSLILCISLILVLPLIISELTIPYTFLSTRKEEINIFISNMKEYVGETNKVLNETVEFINSHINSSYMRPESAFEIDNLLTDVDYFILSLEGYDRVHVILFQGWGSCGQYAAVTEYLLRRLGYETRVARFVDRDHMWAEVKLDGLWYIVDPWYIGKGSVLVLASELGYMPRFKYCKGVTVSYPNGTVVDAGVEHGYYG